MSENRAFRIAEFPLGFWWVRWIDSVSIISAMPGTPTVKVVLSPVPASPAGTVKLVNVAKNANGSQMVEVAIGLIVGLAIGMIFKDGVLVDRLVSEERGFDFDLPRDLVGALPANSEPEIERPSWWTSPRYDVLSASAYPRVLRPDSFCCVLRQDFDKVVAVIPAAEVVRAFIATDSVIATSAFSGPWGTALETLVDVQASSIDGVGNWCVVARGKGLGKSMVVQVGSLMLMFNPAGFKAANLIHATVIAKGARISAALPFDGCRLRFKARCLKLHAGKYLITEITQAEWPHRQGVVLVEPGPLEDLAGDDAQRSYPIDTLALPYDKAEPVDVVSDEAPAQMAETADMFASAVWHGVPAPNVTRGDLRPRPGLVPVPRPGSVTSAAAVGTPSARASVAQAAIGQVPRLPVCTRFEATAAMFDALASRGDIVSWRAVPEPGRSRRLGSRDVWAFEASKPGRRGRWRYVDGARRVVRSAMVCEILLQAGGVAYWIEIEPRPGEAFQSLAIRLGAGAGLAVIRSLLASVAITRGVWGDLGRLAKIAGIRSAATWRHGAPNTGSSSGARALGVLLGLP